MRTVLTFALFVSVCLLNSALGKDVDLRSRPAVATHMVRPEYPYIARARKITGCGVGAMKVNAAGVVEKVEMARSTGSPILDRAILVAFKQWRFKPGSVIGWARSPVCFTMSGLQM